jgi:gluconate 5-dehydrogenase
MEGTMLRAPDFNLDGRVALVTGGSRGLGLAMAEALAAHGAHVVLNGRHAETLERAADHVNRAGGSASIAAFDVNDHDAATAGVAGIAKEFGRLDILINNAGINARKELTEFDTATWQRIVDTNLTSCFVLAREAARPMLKEGWGRIVSTGSVMSITSRASVPAYVAAKHGILGLTRTLGAELGPKGITANAIGPGYFRTEITEDLQQDKEFDGFVKDKTPAGRWGDPEELAGAVVLLASPAGAYINGHLLMVDGGMTCCL